MKKAKNSEIQRLVKKSKTAKAALDRYISLVKTPIVASSDTMTYTFFTSDEKSEGKEDAKDTESKIDEELAMIKVCGRVPIRLRTHWTKTSVANIGMFHHIDYESRSPCNHSHSK